MQNMLRYVAQSDLISLQKENVKIFPNYSLNSQDNFNLN